MPECDRLSSLLFHPDSLVDKACARRESRQMRCLQHPCGALPEEIALGGCDSVECIVTVQAAQRVGMDDVDWTDLKGDGKAGGVGRCLASFLSRLSLLSK